MDSKLQKIIENSSFEITEGKYIYTKVKSYPTSSDHFMITKDKDEITVVTEIEKSPELDLIEKNEDIYKLICLNVSIPFYSVGFLASVSNAIADKNLNILIVSTYSKDYLLVKEICLNKIVGALKELGLNQK